MKSQLSQRGRIFWTLEIDDVTYGRFIDLGFDFRVASPVDRLVDGEPDDADRIGTYIGSQIVSTIRQHLGRNGEPDEDEALRRLEER